MISIAKKSETEKIEIEELPTMHEFEKAVEILKIVCYCVSKRGFWDKMFYFLQLTYHANETF